MNLTRRRDVLVELGNRLATETEELTAIKERAFAANNWFIPGFIDLSLQNIIQQYLQSRALLSLIQKYSLPEETPHPKKVGIVMAGNIPLVGFHDLLCVFITGHQAVIKPSSKDEVLVKYIVKKLVELEPAAAPYVAVSEMLRGCDAYIATGSNNSGRYFEHYFGKYPSIIRKNRTSVAVLSGSETAEDLRQLADDVHLYFGLGCRNVTQLHVPRGYDFVPLLEAFRKYSYFMNHHKYKNNYDYNLAIHILNNRYYMTNDSIILVEDSSPFSPIAQLHYQYYDNRQNLLQKLQSDTALQCIVGSENIHFGGAQQPHIFTYADGINTVNFLRNLS